MKANRYAIPVRRETARVSKKEEAKFKPKPNNNGEEKKKKKQSKKRKPKTAK